MSSGIAAISVCAIGSTIIAAATDGSAMGAVNRPMIAKTESRQVMKDQCLMVGDHCILCVTAKEEQHHICVRTVTI